LNFSFIYCTEAQLREHVTHASYASITAARKYYLDRGNTEVVAQIDRARIQARINRLTNSLINIGN
jgi:hypothetical protein